MSGDAGVPRTPQTYLSKASSILAVALQKWALVSLQTRMMSWRQ